jgi:hypothetical protein
MEKKTNMRATHQKTKFTLERQYKTQMTKYTKL